MPIRKEEFIIPELMTIQELRDFRVMQNWTWSEMSDHVGISMRTLFDYNSGKNPIPLYLTMHCKMIRVHERTKIKCANLENELFNRELF